MFRAFLRPPSVTLFHDARSLPSMQILKYLQGHSEGPTRKNYDLEVTEQPPTSDQLKTIVQYARKPQSGLTLGQLNAAEQSDTKAGPLPTGDRSIPTESQFLSHLIPGANTLKSAESLLKSQGHQFLRPLVVDWNNGRLVVGSDEKGVEKLVKSIIKEENDSNKE